MNSTKQPIPRFSIPELEQWNLLKPGALNRYTFSTVEPGHRLQNFPFRASFYGIGLCKAGNIDLQANLDNYHIQTDSLIVMAPDVIRKWSNQSPDYFTEAMFFTETFSIEDHADATFLKHFDFFYPGAPKVLQLKKEEALLICQLHEQVKNLLDNESRHKDQMMRSYIAILLNLTADYYENHVKKIADTKNTNSWLSYRFKDLLITHYLKSRSVTDYAALLSVTGKHLSETLKAETGKTAGKLIDEMVLLEAKVKLRQHSFTVSQIADQMNFSDVSSFCKFFKRHTGVSPIDYRQK